VLIEEYAATDPIGAQRAGLSDAMIARLDESAAAQILEKAKWYMTRGDPVGARSSLRRLIAKHPQTVACKDRPADARIPGLVAGCQAGAASRDEADDAPSARRGPRRIIQDGGQSVKPFGWLLIAGAMVASGCSTDPSRGYSFTSTHQTSVRSIAGAGVRQPEFSRRESRST
jgi:hypothetical protein